MKTEYEIYQEGQEARQKNQSCMSNPYQPNTWAYNTWMAGWNSSSVEEIVF